MRYAALIVASAATVWVLLILTAPLAPVPFAAFLYVTGSFICHQRPERSFHLAGAQLPVCARCFGIYAGAAFALLATVLRVDKGTVTRPALLMGAAAAPTIVTLAVEWGGVWNPGNVGRALAGFVLGAGVAAVDVTLHYDECTPRRPLASRPPRPRI